MKRTNEAKWSEKEKRWRIAVQKDGVRKVFTSSTPGRAGKRETHAKADAWLDEDISGSVTVERAWNEYMEHLSLTNKKSALLRLDCDGSNYIVPLIGHKKVDKITEEKLQDILDRAYQHGSFNPDKKQRRPPSLPLSRKTLMNLRGTIISFFKYLRRCKYTTLLPESLTIPKGARYKGKKVLQPQALVTLFSEDTTISHGKRIFDKYIYAYRYQVACGLRPGELKGIQVGDINPKNNRVSLQRSINILGEETTGKNKNSIRAFVMPVLAKEAYECQLELLRSMGVKINLTTPLFNIPSQSSYYKAWSRYLESNNIPHISPYELRHTFVSIAKSLPEGQIKSVVGHSMNMDTFGIYGHYITGEDVETAENITNLFSHVIQRVKVE